ncbi:von Willebrand factor type A domain-containing protein [Shimia gijangensis]|uniref:von Willebrand factor type A domain-containing protein n=1 Tax=Shimia gijangensis TaxID=1470563 RepID=A0A1M6HMZ2_9RHOB|nr:Hint domain-containing protein [Shimia gijangensis]SHJ23562.1 von Willebrand factor type A domain-containing protein [Shimia gijangensis]
MPVTGNDDVATSTQVVNPTSNNPESFVQTSTLSLTDNGGLDEDEFCLSVNLTGSNVQEQVNIAIVIDTSGSSGGDSGTDFDGDGTNETILQAELIAAQNLFDEYVAAGYDPSEIDISLVSYGPSAQVHGNFTLDQRDEFNQALQDINAAGSNGTTNYVAGLEAAGDAFTAVGADPVTDTNLVVFLSDGYPIPSSQADVPSGGTTTPIEDAAADLEGDWGAAINGIGLGSASSLDALQQLDNTGGATQVLSTDELLDVIIEPLTDAEFLRFEIEIEGLDENGVSQTQTIILDASDPLVIQTPTAIDVSLLPIDAEFAARQDVTVTVTSVFGPDPGDPPDVPAGTTEQNIVTEHELTLVVCFTPGTHILTLDGTALIEDLVAGDKVVTRDHGAQTIRWIGSTTLSGSYVSANKRLRPILIRKGALGPDQPARDMRVSRQHRILVRDWRAELMFGKPDGVLVPAFALCNDNTIIEDHAVKDVTYFHMAFDNHEIVYADGVEAESFHPVAETVAGLISPQRKELLELFPELDLEGATAAYGGAREELRGRIARVLPA